MKGQILLLNTHPHTPTPTHTHTFVGFIHFQLCAYLMTELGLKMGYSMLLFSTHKNRKPTTYRLYTLTECTDVPQPLQCNNAQHSVCTLVQQR